LDGFDYRVEAWVLFAVSCVFYNLGATQCFISHKENELPFSPVISIIYLLSRGLGCGTRSRVSLAGIEKDRADAVLSFLISCFYFIKLEEITCMAGRNFLDDLF
jgi:hypothetical protein